MANVSELMSESARQLGARSMGVQQDDNVHNAETDGRTLYFSPRFMSDLERAAGTDGVRFVIAHELGHQVGGMDVGGHAGEFMADEYAARSLAQSGGDVEAIDRVFSFLGPSHGPTHPSNGSRTERARIAFNNARAEHAGCEDTTKKSRDRAHDRDLAI